MLAPIVVFAYNRADHVKRLIDSLAKNELANKSDLFIFSDGAKDEKDRIAVENVRSEICTLKEKDLFNKVTVNESATNRGLAQSIIAGVTQVIKQYGSVIVLEDDLVVSPYFLNFMNEALTRYKDVQRVWSISGFTRDIEFLHNVDVDMYFSVRAQSWSWGTWSDRWNKMDWDVSDYNKFKWSLKERKSFNAGGNDMASMLDRQQCGIINSWAIRFCYGQYKNDGLTVQPTETLVQNGGQDGSGTNCNYIREVSNISSKREWKFREVENDQEINSELKRTRKHIPAWKLLGSFMVYVVLKGSIRV